MAKKTKFGNDTTIPDNVREAFNLLIDGKNKTEAANTVNTSTRSLGRWMEKYDYESYALTKQSRMSLLETAQAYYKQWQAGMIELADLLSFKRARKKGWEALGMSEKQINTIRKYST